MWEKRNSVLFLSEKNGFQNEKKIVEVKLSNYFSQKGF